MFIETLMVQLFDFSKCARNPKDSIVLRVTDMGKMFCEKYAQVIKIQASLDFIIQVSEKKLEDPRL